MRFQQSPPPPQLADLVRCYWSVDSGGDGQLPRSFNTMADGFSGAMVVLQGGAVLRDSVYGDMPPGFLYGQATTCRTLGTAGRLCAVGLYFQPHALRSLFGLQADAHTDACFDLTKTFRDAANANAVLHAADAPAAMAALNEHFTALRVINASLHDTPIAQAAAALVQAKGDADLDALIRISGLTTRTFERRFKKSIGIPLRLFARIRRFQHTLQLLREGRYGKLSDIAYAADYADQSHYIRSFKEFTGISPLEYKRDGHEVVENLVELPRP